MSSVLLLIALGPFSDLPKEVYQKIFLDIWCLVTITEIPHSARNLDRMEQSGVNEHSALSMLFILGLVTGATPILKQTWYGGILKL